MAAFVFTMFVCASPGCVVCGVRMHAHFVPCPISDLRLRSGLLCAHVDAPGTWCVTDTAHSHAELTQRVFRHNITGSPAVAAHRSP